MLFTSDRLMRLSCVITDRMSPVTVIKLLCPGTTKRHYNYEPFLFVDIVVVVVY